MPTDQTSPDPKLHAEESNWPQRRAGIIGGIIGGAAAFMLIALGLGRLKHRRRNQKRYLDSDGPEIRTEADPFPSSHHLRTVLPLKMRGAQSRPVAPSRIDNPMVDILNGLEESNRNRASGARPHFEDLLVEVEDLRRVVQDLRAGEMEPPPTYYTA